MNGKKNIFGYAASLLKTSPKNQQAWFDPASFLIEAKSTLPNKETEGSGFWIGKMMIIFGAILMAFRLTTLQVVQGSEHQVLAEGNRLRRQVIVAPRGSITDRTGAELVKNEPSFILEVIPSDLPRTKEERQTIYETIAITTNRTAEEIRGLFEDISLTSLDPVVIRSTLTQEEAMVYKLKFADYPAIRVSYAPIRQYDTTPGLSHILGYTSKMSAEDIKKHPDYHLSSPIGRSGLESSYDVDVRGETGLNEIEVNASGQYQRLLKNTPPNVGKTLVLSLDKGLQQEMVAALQEAMQKNNAQEAVGVAMDPQTGEILASVSLPSYDNNQFADGVTELEFSTLNNDPLKPLLNRVISGVYPAGSTIKPLVAAGALQEGTIKSDTRLDTSIGVIEIGQWKFPDWKVHGMADVRQAIAESNDIFFYALGGGWDHIPGLGVDRLKKYFSMFGLGDSTHLDYAQDSAGLIPDADWKKKRKKESWYIGDTYHMAIGQGDLLTTPLQMVRSISSLVNGGRLVTPHVVKATQEGDNEQQDLPFSEKKIDISPQHLRVVQEGMRRTVESGSARTLNTLPFISAGKTGTAQFGTEEKTHAWYVGYAPYDNPKIAVAILIPGGGEGNAIAVPAAGRILSHYLK